jgi:hypothetical protein
VLHTDAAPGGIIFDATGEALLAHPVCLARRFGCLASDVVDYAIRKLGFVYVAPIREALLVKFEPSAVNHLAAVAAFYEIAGHAQKRIILGSPGRAGSPDRYEIFTNFMEGLRRIEATLFEHEGSTRLREQEAYGSQLDIGVCQPPGKQHTGREHAAGFSRPGGVAIKMQASIYSKRLARPLDSISSKDEWLGHLLINWRNARSGWRLPSSDTLDPLQLLNVARGRAHIVDTHASNPAGYRFRVWGTVNSYGVGHAGKSLGDMPTGLMRDHAIEDYWEVVTTGVPAYQLIMHVENKAQYSYARLVLPLAADGRRVAQLVVLINERPLPELEVP